MNHLEWGLCLRSFIWELFHEAALTQPSWAHTSVVLCRRISGGRHSFALRAGLALAFQGAAGLGFHRGQFLELKSARGTTPVTDKFLYPAGFQLDQYQWWKYTVQWVCQGIPVGTKCLFALFLLEETKGKIFLPPPFPQEDRVWMWSGNEYWETTWII